MFRACALGFVAASCILAAGAPAHAQSQQKAIYVSALDKSGAPVPFLEDRDISVKEDKTEREILDITPSADPMEVVLLVDNSQASEPFIRDYRQAIPAFIRTIGESAEDLGVRHQISIVTLADRPTINTDYTIDMATALKGAERIFAMPGSGTYLLDAIVETTRGIVRRTAVRPIIVAITTEGPEMSNRQYQAVLGALRESGAAFHVVVVGRQVNNGQDRGIVLDQGTKGSGGRYETLLTSSALTARMRQVADDLTHHFKVTYARPRTLIPPEEITVSAVKAGITVRGTPAREPKGQ